LYNTFRGGGASRTWGGGACLGGKNTRRLSKRGHLYLGGGKWYWGGWFGEGGAVSLERGIGRCLHCVGRRGKIIHDHTEEMAQTKSEKVIEGYGEVRPF